MAIFFGEISFHAPRISLSSCFFWMVVVFPWCEKVDKIFVYLNLAAGEAFKRFKNHVVMIRVDDWVNVVMASHL